MPFVFLFLLLFVRVAHAQVASPPLPVLDVPFISQSEALCGGAAAAMVLRYWGERGLAAESFAHLVDRSASGIRTAALTDDLRARGWNAVPVTGTDALARREQERGRPVIALIEDRPGVFHYVVVVAWHDRGVVLHDPARAPFRVMPRDEFTRRWATADSWMLVLVPNSVQPAEQPAVQPPSESQSSCEQLIADGVRAAQVRDIPTANRALTAALSCPGGAAPRELAGVRLLERRWDEVRALSLAAIASDPADVYTWKLLATSRFVQGDSRGALAAWNKAGEPRLDLVRIDGLTRTRHRVVEHLMGLPAGETLTLSAFARARRRLSELPSATSTRLEFVPVPSGLAEARAVVSERSLTPRGTIPLAVMGLTTAVSRDLRVTVGSMSGGGERLTGSWRFWPRRPRLALALQAPAPWQGVWGVDLEAERQPFTGSVLAPAERVSVRFLVSDWATGTARWQLRSGFEDRPAEGSLAIAGGEIRHVTTDDRIVSRAEANMWLGRADFGTLDVSALMRSTTERRGNVLLARGGLQFASRQTPLDRWSAGDTGQARSSLLRAHPVLQSGRLRVEQLGRSLAGASVEAQRWWRLPRGVQAGGAVFIDAARTGHRFEGGRRYDADLGVGARLGMLGLPGMLRIDLGKGLRDGATALSVVYEP